MKAALALAVLVVTLSVTPVLLWTGIMVLVPIAMGPAVLLLAAVVLPALLVSAVGAGVSGRAAATPPAHFYPGIPGAAH